MSTDSGLDRLGRALALWLEHRAQGAVDPGPFLARHEDLRDLLEPMFEDGGDPAPARLGAGSVVGDFRLVRELGRGGMGVVYEARQRSLDRIVALKLLLPGAALQPRTLARFHREAATAARLEHPGIVAVHAFGEHDGSPWFAMERIDGEPLDRHVSGLRADASSGWLAPAVRLVAEVADALQYAHAHGVVHRDIKPSNVLVRPDGKPAVTDFGLARSSGLPSLSQDGEFAGTPNYVSPEQARGAADVDARSDVFSLGVTLYELLTQQLPFRGDTTRAVLDDIQRVEPRPPSRLHRDLPRVLDAVVLQALAKEPGRRYQTMAGFAADLRRFLEHRPVLARAPGLGERALLYMRREPLKAGLAAAILVAGVLALYLWGNDRALRRGNDALAADRVEALVLDATIGPSSGMSPQRKQALLGQILEYGRTDPYAAVIVAEAHEGSHRPAEALAVLEEFGARCGWSAAARRLQRHILQRRDGQAPGPDLPPPVDALDHYVCGGLMLARAVHGEPELAAKALAHMQSAVAMSDRPRAVYLIACNRAGRVADNWDSVHVACDALVHHWPGSAVSHCLRAMAWFDVDRERARSEAERGLELAPDNFPSLVLLADLARLEGRDADAEALLARANTLHPQQAQFQFRPAPHDAGARPLVPAPK